MSEARRLIQVRRPGLIVPQWPFSLNRQTPQAEGLVGWWPNVVSGGTKIHDLSGRGLNGVATNPAFGRNSFGGREITYNGTSSRVDILQNVVIAEPFTLVTWCNPSAVASGDAVIGIADKDTGTQQHRIVVEVGGAFAANTFDGTASEAAGTTTVVDNTNYLVAGVFASGSSRKIYVNGIQEGTENTDARMVSGLDRLTIGVTADSTPSGFWDGSIWGTLLYKGVPSDEVLYSLYDPASRWDLYKPQSRTSYYWIPSPVSTISLPLTQIRKPRSATKPLGPVKLDCTSSLSKGLIRGWLFEPGIGGAGAFKGLTGDEKAVTFGSEIDSSDWGVHGELGHGLTGLISTNNSHIDIGEEFDSESFTVAIWAVPTFAYTDGNLPALVGNINNSASEGWLLDYQTSADTYRFLCRRSGGLQNCSGPQITSDLQLGRNKANLFVAGSDAAGAFLDVNGVEQATSSVTGTYVSAGRNHYLLSNNGFSVANNGHWGGSQHVTMIWNRVLSKAERKMLYDPATRWSMLKEIRPRILTIPGALPPPVSGIGAAVYHYLRLMGIYS